MPRDNTCHVQVAGGGRGNNMSCTLKTWGSFPRNDAARVEPFFFSVDDAPAFFPFAEKALALLPRTSLTTSREGPASLLWLTACEHAMKGGQ